MSLVTKFAVTAFFVLVGLWSTRSEAAMPAGISPTEGATVFIQALGDRAILIFASRGDEGDNRQRVEAIKEIILENVDLSVIGRFALGAHWSETTEAQKARYERLFRDYVLTATARRLDTYRFARFHIARSQLIAGGDVLVETIVERPVGPEARVAWRVRAENRGFKIVDVIVEGVSMALTQRQEFAAVIGRESLEGLLGLLDAKVAEFRAAPGPN